MENLNQGPAEQPPENQGLAEQPPPPQNQGPPPPQNQRNTCSDVDKKFCDSDNFTALKEKYKASPLNSTLEEACVLYNNAKFYYTCGQTVGALVSYSCAAVLLNSLIQNNAINNEADKEMLQKIMCCCLSAVKDLQGKVNVSGSSKKADDEDTQDLDKICVKYKPLMFKKGSSDCIFFDDVAGLEKEKKIMEYSLVYPLMYPNLYPKASRGILIYGPPGTGKTYLVKAAVNFLQARDPSVGVLFFAPSPGDLKGKYVGETEKRIEEVFTCASEAACKYESACHKKYISIIFMDEMDAIGPNRDTDNTGLAVNSVNTLLQMMDGVKSFANVAVVAATNYPWNLDGAILRRFDTQVLIGLPGETEMKQLLDIEINRMINLGADKSDFDYCDSKKTKTTDNKEAPLICKLECENIKKKDLYVQAPYTDLVIDYYEQSKKGGLIYGIINKLYQDNFSNSDITRLLKSAATNAGELAIKASLFYSTKLIDDLIHDKYISCLTKLKKRDKAIKESVKIIDAFASPNGKLPDYIYQINTPKITNITCNGATYWNIKCLFYKDERIFLLDHPSIDDIYIKYDNTGSEQDKIKKYTSTVLGDEIDIIVSFKYIFKKTSNSNNNPLLPVSTNLIRGVFNPLSNLFNTIKNNLEKDTTISAIKPTTTIGGGPVTDNYKEVFEFNDGNVASIREGSMFTNTQPIQLPLEINGSVKKIVKSVLYKENVLNSILDKKNKIYFEKFETHNIELAVYFKLLDLLSIIDERRQGPDQVSAVYRDLVSGYGPLSYFYNDYVQNVGISLSLIESMLLPENNADYEIKTFKKRSDNSEYSINYNKRDSQYILSIGDVFNLFLETSQRGKYFDIFISFLDGAQKDKFQQLFSAENKQEKSLAIDIDSFNIIFSSVLQDIYPPKIDLGDPTNKYYLTTESKMIQLYIDDIYSFYSLGKSLDKTADVSSCLKQYLKKLVSITSIDKFVDLACNRLYDNFKYVQDSKTFCPPTPPPPQPGGGSQTLKRKSQTLKRKIKPFGNKTLSLRETQNYTPESDSNSDTEKDNDTGKEKENYEMRGGADIDEIENFKRFCENEFISAKEESVVNKNIFIQTKFLFKNLDMEQIRGGIFNTLWYDAGGLPRKGVRWAGEKIGVWTTEQIEAYKKEKSEEMRKKVEKENLLLPLLFKEVTAIGFLSTDAGNKTVNDDSSENTKISWSNLDSGGTVRTIFTDWLVPFIAATQRADNRSGWSDVISKFTATILNGGSFYAWYYVGAAVGSTTGVGLIVPFVFNLYNFISSKQSPDEIVNNILLTQVISMIREGYLETQNDLTNTSPNTIFIEKLSETLKNFQSWYNQWYLSTAIPTMKSTPVLIDIKMYKIPANIVVPKNIKNKLVNISIPMQSFYYALSVVKTTYSKDTGKMLLEYYEDKDKFLENQKKKLKPAGSV
jgi:SpoVK/Ycf46/Vps4 family AAA+-type ATPase